MLRVGIVGPQSTVERIIHIAQGLKLDVIFLTYPYKEVKETEDIIKNNSNNVDFWIFSGRISYNIACEAEGNTEKQIYIEHTEAGIFKGLLEFSFKTGSFLDHVSIDEISKSHLETALNQLNIQPKNIFVKTFSEKTSTEELIDFHLQLWDKGDTRGAITCFEEVYLQLKEKGVPAFRISTSDIEIQHTLNILSEKIKTFYFMDSQVAVQLFEMDHLENHFKSSKQTYQLQFMELKLKEILINLSEHLNGSLVEKGLGRYLIFSSRGDSEREIQKIEETVNNMILESGLKVGVGIGFGETVFSAELNANNALRLSKERFGSIIIVQENGEVVEAESENIEMFDYPYFNDKNFMTNLQNAKISVKHYIEIFSLIRNAGIKDFTIKDISMQLSKDERNTRRFIEGLCEAGLAECIGVEEYPTRGRPRRVYKLINSPYKTNMAY
ncbi:hypothetical protein BGM26_18050 [Bacillus sp. FJAT-29790]|uniref:hypothetical protein n=1 Tax=Bacillus sp. FJAT-29790 TaxID=1895002 RepID=UPI001C2501AB|nr:hypothetical protein [Bacillus sp. FJAT-29790]MBU8880859.1 hypothetical protein [Bacillus sp. FJAT-29790]